MAILGIERIIYCVDDVDKCVEFFEDYGLSLKSRASTNARFLLPDGSIVILQDRGLSPVADSSIVGQGVHEVVWGVDTQANLEELVAGVAIDRPVRRDDEGIHHFVADGGLIMGLRHWHERTDVVTTVDPVNSPGNLNRLNVHRRWITRARPRAISHVVFQVPEYEAGFFFLRDRLNFRLSDRQAGFGLFARADGSYEHHNIYLLNANAEFPSVNGSLRFDHVNFTVADMDEIMIGKNYMERRGWPPTVWGLGRHRIASALFLYLPCPAGGEVEYGADSDAIDDSWVPRNFDAMFGFAHWIHEMPDFWFDGANWKVDFVEEGLPSRGSIGRHPFNEDPPVPKAAAE